jgi:hypothetical protein
MKRWLLLLAGVLLVSAAPSGVRAQSGTISPGMTAEQVRGVFGSPATVREAGEWTYWYYHNGCPRSCGSDDVVFLRDGRVVAAVLRTARRRISGPHAHEAIERAPEPEPARVGGIRIEGAADDAPQRSMDVQSAPTTGGSLRVDGEMEVRSGTP